MKIKSIRYAGKMDVFNMEVDDTHDFVIQGGVISHNCADEARYFCMSRPIKPREIKPPSTYKQGPLYQYLDIKEEDLTPARRTPRMEIVKHADV